MIGSVPQSGIQFVRIHYLLDLIKLLPVAEVERLRVNGDSTAGSMDTFDEATAAPYLLASGTALNFTGLDAAMDQLHSSGLSPGFEVMGNPGAISWPFSPIFRFRVR